MTNRQDLFLLLAEREGEWVSRDNIDFVGGSDAARRMRELRDDVSKSGQYRLEERKDDKGRLEYRLIKLLPPTEQSPAIRERYNWVCVKCDSHPSDYAKTQPSVDPRWRIGPCHSCGGKGLATFKRLANRMVAP